MAVFDQRKDQIRCGRILELGETVGGGHRHDPFGIDQKLDQRGCRVRSVEFAERHRHLLADAGIGIGN